MSKINFPKKQEQRLIPKYLLEYSEELVKNHPDPSESWGGGSGGSYTAGTGIDITNNVISVDNDVAMKTDIPDVSDFVTSTELGNELEDYELKSEAFSGSYTDLSNKPDLTVYELKSEAFSGDYDDLTDKPDLSVYELKSEAFSGNYNDLTNKPTIPTATSDLTNDSGFITSAALTSYVTTTQLEDALDDYALKTDIPENVSDLTNDAGYTTQTWVQNQGYITGITSSDVVTALGYTPGTSNFSGDYDDLTDKPDLSVYELKSEAFSGDYNDLTNKPTIPTVNDATITFTQGGVSKGSITLNQSSNQTIALDAGSTPSNMVTTNTTQNITGEKTFIGDKRIKFKQSTSSDKLGFTLYTNANNEKGFLEYNPTDDGMYLGRYGTTRVNELGFKTGKSGSSHKLLVPNVTLSGNVTDYIPISVNNTKADSSGNISLAIPDVSNYYTKTEVDNLIPTVPTNVSAFTNDAGYITGITSSDVTTALGYTPGTSNFSGDYDDLTNKPTIPDAVSGTNDGTNWTSLTIGNDTYNIPAGGSSTNLWYHKIHIVTHYNNSYQLLYAEMILPTSSQITTIAGLFSTITQDDNPNAVLFGQYRRTASVPSAGFWTGNSTVFIAIGKNPRMTEYSGYLITNIGVTGSSAGITYGNTSTQNIAWSNIPIAVEGTEYNHATYKEYQCWDIVTPL